MPRLVRPTPALSLTLAIALGGGAVALAACSGDDDDADDEARDVGRLETVAEDDGLAEAVDVAGGGDGVWVVSGDGTVLEVTGDGLAEVEGLDEVSAAAGVGASDDGTLFATDPDRASLVRYRDGRAAASEVPAVRELSALTAATDGTVFVADHDALQVVSISADGKVGESVGDALAGPLSVAPDGTLYYVDDQVLGGRIVALAPGGGPEGLTQEVERDEDGNPVEPPAEGAAAGDSYIEARDIAATGDGLLVLTFTNEVWRIGDDGRLELVLRRGDGSALVALGAAGDEVYVLDAGAATLSTIDAGP